MNTPITVVPGQDQRMPVAVGAGLTNRGMVRERNEDSILTDPTGALWAVADGMGGYGNGDVASEIVIDCLAQIPDGVDPGPALVARLQEANGLVLQRQRSPGMGRMGATVVAVLISGAVAHVAWVGDSRAYLLRGGRLRPLTRDHSVVQEMIDRGELSPAEAERHPESHVITRAVGGGAELDVDLISVPLAIGDRLLLCSDGLTRCVYEQTVEALLRDAASPEDACQKLVREALDSGAPDNVSTIAVHIREG
ncbi:MAG: protein phosphatase 2C domain-containing protein [Tabrizicola sp.]|uniref:PP2C family protein-serine/threonine phosphatase n=1 Tax=Tabrizicola sp. TaxID=2005166 RepID=UPI002AB939B1|nr:protein phosphatase 2C domain-containing protein [Tabrizicola sp.]MDZ4087835.1 protein phosphatase 2C domain-containing protein [Tabrizicola sp.]